MYKVLLKLSFSLCHCRAYLRLYKDSNILHNNKKDTFNPTNRVHKMMSSRMSLMCGHLANLLLLLSCVVCTVLSAFRFIYESRVFILFCNFVAPLTFDPYLCRDAEQGSILYLFLQNILLFHSSVNLRNIIGNFLLIDNLNATKFKKVHKVESERKKNILKFLFSFSIFLIILIV